MDQAKQAVETVKGAMLATEDDLQAIRALDDLELVLAGGGGDNCPDWG